MQKRPTILSILLTVATPYVSGFDVIPKVMGLYARLYIYIYIYTYLHIYICVCFRRHERWYELMREVIWVVHIWVVHIVISENTRCDMGWHERWHEYMYVYIHIHKYIYICLYVCVYIWINACAWHRHKWIFKNLIASGCASLYYVLVSSTFTHMRIDLFLSGKRLWAYNLHKLKKTKTPIHICVYICICIYIYVL